MQNIDIDNQRKYWQITIEILRWIVLEEKTAELFSTSIRLYHDRLVIDWGSLFEWNFSKWMLMIDEAC